MTTVDLIARRIARWARSGSIDPAKTAGYCMSGHWSNFYQSLLYPNKMLSEDIASTLVQKLRVLGFEASLDAVPFENGAGNYLYMRMARI